MSDIDEGTASALQRSYGVIAVALSEQRRAGVRLVSGAQRTFGLDAALQWIHVPYPADPAWTRRTLTGGIALQCAPSKERVIAFRLHEMTTAELRALTLVEAGAALGWIGVRWPGLLPDLCRALPDVEILDADLDAHEIFSRAITLAEGRRPLCLDALLGQLPAAHTRPHGLGDKLRRSLGRLPWTTAEKRQPGRTRFRWAATAGCAIRTCHRRAVPMTTTST